MSSLNRIKSEENGRRISKESSQIVYAAEDGDTKMVARILATAPALVNTKTSAGWTALHMAARFGHEQCLEVLIKHGANVNSRSYSNSTPLHEAVCNNQPKSVMILLTHGCDVDLQDRDGETALRLAAEFQFEFLIKLLIKNGANTFIPNTEGTTPFSTIQSDTKLMTKLESLLRNAFQKSAVTHSPSGRRKSVV